MLFGKKKEVYKPAKFTPLYIRVSSLFNSVNLSTCNIYSQAKVKRFESSEVFNSSNKYISFDFESNNGLIEFTIKSSGENFKSYTIIYKNNQSKWMFDLYCDPENTIVRPDMGKNIFASDIDLALFEIEQFIEDIMIQNISGKNIHNLELTKLENLDFKC